MPSSPHQAQGVLVGLVLAGLLIAGPASAHANLVDAEPRPNTRIDDAPTQLTLRFSEPLEDTYTRIQVIGPNQTHHEGPTQIDPDQRRTATVPLEPLPDGLYTVRWRTLSSADGHTRSGVYLLAINTSLTQTPTPNPTPTPTPTQTNTTQPAPTTSDGSPAEALTRGVSFLGASLAAGTPLFLLITYRLTLPRHARTRWSNTAILGALTAATATLVLFLLYAHRIDSPLPTAASTQPGQNLLLRVAAFTLAGLLYTAGERGPWPKRRTSLTSTGCLLALGGLLLTTLGGHATADGAGAGLQILIDWLHQASVAFWISGLAALLIGLRTGLEASAAAHLVRRFSPLAVASVALIAITGTLAAIDRLTSLNDLIDAIYGLALSTKILLFIPLVVLGAYNRYHVQPLLETIQTSGKGLARLKRSVHIEALLMGLVLLAAGVLTATSPPTPNPQATAPFATFDEARNADTPGPYAPDLAQSSLATLNQTQASHIQLKLLTPNTTTGLSQGTQPLWLLLYNNQTQTPIPDAKIQLDAWMPRHGHGTTPETDPTHTTDGFYHGSTTWSMAGTWEIRINATLASDDRLRYTIPVEVYNALGEPAQPPPTHTFTDSGYRFDVRIAPTPVTIGAQNLTIHVTPPADGFPERADVIANLKPPSNPHGEGETLQLTEWTNGTWSKEGALFVEEGTWRVLIALQGKGTYVSDTFELDVQAR